jgi:hypothetical protein
MLLVPEELEEGAVLRVGGADSINADANDFGGDEGGLGWRRVQMRCWG